MRGFIEVKDKDEPYLLNVNAIKMVQKRPLGCKITMHFDVPAGDDAVLNCLNSYDEIMNKIIGAT